MPNETTNNDKRVEILLAIIRKLAFHISTSASESKLQRQAIHLKEIAEKIATADESEVNLLANGI